MYECPNCGANLKFDIASQQLLCRYCDTKLDPYLFQKERDAQENRESSDEYEVTIFTCPQCGGELISDDSTAATFCSFCGGATILDSRISREKRPGYIIPFQKTKEDCREAYARMMRRAIFAPEELRDEGQLEHFRSIYMPYWVYSFEKKGHVSFEGSKCSRSGDYKITRYYRLESDVDAELRGISFDASASFSDSLSNAIAPFEWEGAMPFAPSFLSGFYADTSDVPSGVYEDNASDVVTQELCEQMKKDPVCRKYTLSGLERSMQPKIVGRELAMFPVWFLAYRKNDRVSYAVVNGQTGKAAADLPIDRKKYLLGSLALAVPIFILLNLLVSMKVSSMLLWTVLLLAICCVISIRQERELKARETDADDEGLEYVRAVSGTLDIDLVSSSPRSLSEIFGVGNLLKGGSSPYSSVIRIITVFILIEMSEIFLVPFGVSVSVMTYVFALALIAVIFSSVGKRNTRKAFPAKRLKLDRDEYIDALLKPGFGLFLVIGVVVARPVSDLFYYGAALAAMGLIAWNIMDIIDRYNLLATRKLPQFNRRGGADNV